MERVPAQEPFRRAILAGKAQAMSALGFVLARLSAIGSSLAYVVDFKGLFGSANGNRTRI